jgi:O-antigen/teichoic acid export membrane protein
MQAPASGVARAREREPEAGQPAQLGELGELGDAAPVEGPRDELSVEPRPLRTRGLWSGVSLMVASQLALGAVGVLSLPVLARNLGPASYGAFSLFVTVLGIVTYQDFARQILVHAGSRAGTPPSEIRGLARFNQLCLLALAASAGLAIFDLPTALALTAAAALHGLSSRDFAALSIAGRVGAATAMRNLAWALAFAAVAAGSFLPQGPASCAWPFVAANGLVFLAYRRLCGSRLPAAGGSSAPASRSLADLVGWSALRRSESWPRYRRDILDLLGFTVAASVLVSADRILLERTADGSELGQYVGHADLAAKLHILSSALGSALFPMLAREVAAAGFEPAAKRFVRISSWTVSAGFVLVLGLMLFDRSVVALVLGPAFLPSAWIYRWMLLGIFAQLFGFLITPWQRAQGDFATQRRAYNRAAVVMILAGLALIPLYGCAGALAAFLCSRLAEAQLVAHEVRRLPRSILPRWKVGAALGMLAVLALVAAWRMRGGL